MSDELDETLAQRLARIGAEAEAAEADEDDGAPLPAHVKVSRPNRARSKVLEVRLNPEELDALEALAAQRQLPVSTIARAKLLELITPDLTSAARAPEDYAAMSQAVEAGEYTVRPESLRMGRPTSAEYAELAADYAATPPTADEIAGPIEDNPTHRRKGD